jgi:hypothetical protein
MAVVDSHWRAASGPFAAHPGWCRAAERVRCPLIFFPDKTDYGIETNATALL